MAGGWHPSPQTWVDMWAAGAGGGHMAENVQEKRASGESDAAIWREVQLSAHGDTGLGAAIIGGAEAIGLSYLAGGFLGELGGAAAAPVVDSFDVNDVPPVDPPVEETPVFDEWDFGDVDFGSAGDLGEGGYDFSLGDIDLSGGGQIIRSLTGGGGGGPMVTQTGAMGGAAAAAAGVALRSLWGVLRAGGGRMSTFVINGVRGRMSDLWPAVRKYGPGAVAVALGIGADQLAQLLTQAPTSGRRKRRRGISASNISTARRVIKFNRQLTRQLGTGGGRRSGPPGYRGGRRPRWVRVDGY